MSESAPRSLLAPSHSVSPAAQTETLAVAVTVTVSSHGPCLWCVMSLAEDNRGCGKELTKWRLSSLSVESVSSRPYGNLRLGILPDRVPTTARAKLLALHSVVAPAARTPEARNNCCEGGKKIRHGRRRSGSDAKCCMIYIYKTGPVYEQRSVTVPFLAVRCRLSNFIYLE